MENNIILTGDRPTGPLHLGHYVGSLRKRVEMQNKGKYVPYVMIADLQALTDNADNPQKIRDNIMEVMLDYLAAGLTPDKTTFLVQSHIPALYELPMYYSNLVTMSRLERNPTIKNEIKMRKFERSIPVGFMTYPISQAADITAFKAKYVPVGEDQLPMLEQARESVREQSDNLLGIVREKVRNMLHAFLMKLKSLVLNIKLILWYSRLRRMNVTALLLQSTL